MIYTDLGDDGAYTYTGYNILLVTLPKWGKKESQITYILCMSGCRHPSLPSFLVF
jgi:hypothetical protein